MAIDPRRQVVRNPYMPQRKDMADYFGGDNGRIKGFSQKQRYGGGDAGGDSFNPSAMFTNPMAMALGAYNIGLQADASGTLQPTQDFGQMATLQSQQLNSLSPGVDPRQQTSLGKPLGAMYAMNPNTWKNRPGGTAGFGDAVAQRNQTMVQGGGIPNPLQPSYQKVVKAVDQAAAGGGTGTSVSDAVAALGRDTKVPTMEQRRAPLQEQVDAKRMLGQATGDIPTLRVHYTDAYGGDPGRIGSNVNEFFPGEDAERDALGVTDIYRGGKKITGPLMTDQLFEGPRGKYEYGTNISGKYGTGSAEFFKPGTPRKEGLINGRPASEVLQGLANKPGIARAGDRFQPQKSTPAESKAMNTALSKFPMKNPLRKR